jgi:hypothetical protein
LIQIPLSQRRILVSVVWEACYVVNRTLLIYFSIGYKYVKLEGIRERKGDVMKEGIDGSLGSY